MSTEDRDWLEDVFFHDSIETLKRKHAKMIEILRKNPVTVHAEEAIRWMEICAQVEWPAGLDDLRVVLRVMLVSRLKEQQPFIPFSPRMVRELDYINYAFDCFYAGQVFAYTHTEIVNMHHLHHLLAIRVFHTTTHYAPVNIKLFVEQAPAVNSQTPRPMISRLYDLYRRVEKERARLSRLLQPEFYEDLKSEWSQAKRKLDLEEEEEEERVKVIEEEEDDNDNVFAVGKALVDLKKQAVVEDEEDASSSSVFKLPSALKFSGNRFKLQPVSNIASSKSSNKKMLTWAHVPSSSSKKPKIVIEDEG